MPYHESLQNDGAHERINSVDKYDGNEDASDFQVVDPRVAFIGITCSPQQDVQLGNVQNPHEKDK